MQVTRKAILEILKKQGQATVDELAEQMNLTPMTVRHHLNVLKAEDLVLAARLRHRQSAGRPRQVYTLTEAGNDFFPANYDGLADHLLYVIKQEMDSNRVRQIFQRIGEKLAEEAPNMSGLSLPERVIKTAEFLTAKGFISRWEEMQDGYVLRMFNCPYRHVASEHSEVCIMDRTLISQLVGIQPKRLHGTASQGEHCAYFFPYDLTPQQK